MTDFDFQEFAKQVAAELGGEYQSPTKVETSPVPLVLAHILIGNDRLSLRNLIGQDKVRVKIDPADHPRGAAHDPTLPEANLLIPRGSAAVAKDIKRRVIDPAQERLAKIREELAKQQAGIAAIDAAAEALKSFGVEVTDKNDGYEVPIQIRDPGIYFKGSINASGRVHVDRLGSVSVEQFKKILQILKEE